MAHVRESFPTLEDAITKEGIAIHKSENGDASAGKIGSTVWAFKDSAGNLVHPQLNTEGALVVTSEGAGIPKSATSNGEIVGALTLTDICEVSLSVSKTYGRISANGSCFKETIFYLVQLNDAAETILGSFIVGPGEYSYKLDLGTTEVTSGATGTQKLILKAKNLNKASDFLGNVACLEFAA
jgi:hypothetical protein